LGSLTVTNPSDREIAMSRVFEAPRQLVFDAQTTPALLTYDKLAASLASVA
jgi:uncharacterized protein YndB with AHSA1/START domain